MSSTGYNNTMGEARMVGGSQVEVVIVMEEEAGAEPCLGLVAEHFEESGGHSEKCGGVLEYGCSVETVQ